jgi:hypothetical protein
MNVRDIIEIFDDLKKTEFAVRDQRCRSVVPSGLLRMQIFREGDETRTVLAEYPVWQRTMNGELVFYWDELLTALAPGYYTGEFQIACSTCAVIRFRKRACGVTLTPTRHVYTEPCAPGCEVSPGLDSVGTEGCPPQQQVGECGATPYPPNRVPTEDTECRPYDGVGVAAQTGSCVSPGPVGSEPGGLCGS